MARQAKKSLLLNEQTLELHADVLLIADEQRPLAMAAVMGGEDSGITLATTELFLESAFFAPQGDCRPCPSLWLCFRRGASFRAWRRFRQARGAHSNARRAGPRYLRRPGRAGERSAGESAGAPTGSPAPGARRQGAWPVDFLSGERIERAVSLASTLAFRRDGDDFIVTPPSYRFDIEIEEDLIEEIVRLHGYENIPCDLASAALSMLPQRRAGTTPGACAADARRLRLSGGGQLRLRRRSLGTPILPATSRLIRLANPIASQLSVMRSTLIGGLVANVPSNLKRGRAACAFSRPDAAFFAIRSVEPVAGFRQPWKLTALAYGSALSRAVGLCARNVDFFDVKGDLELLLAPLTAASRQSAASGPASRRSARVWSMARRLALSASCIRSGSRNTNCRWRRCLRSRSRCRDGGPPAAIRGGFASAAGHTGYGDRGRSGTRTCSN
jgi:phenylalanyl-tRNA synthetase beta chain